LHCFHPFVPPLVGSNTRCIRMQAKQPGLVDCPVYFRFQACRGKHDFRGSRDLPPPRSILVIPQLDRGFSLMLRDLKKYHTDTIFESIL
jgi:hypothetical protein